ncbi:hypothetical protein [Tenacibaculum mesophilum]|uniref:hypothetical protein n=1 Tax=Tenacibaculum mesophilum TaxID=104268 RepID=UPI00248FD017|nr:hypothetical protein [Tenacibaculum mesophilum]
MKNSKKEDSLFEQFEQFECKKTSLKTIKGGVMSLAEPTEIWICTQMEAGSDDYCALRDNYNH